MTEEEQRAAIAEACGWRCVNGEEKVAKEFEDARRLVGF